MSEHQRLLKCQHGDIFSQHTCRDVLSVRVCIFRAAGGTLGSPEISNSKWVTWFPETQKEWISREPEDSNLPPSLSHTHILFITLHYSPTVGIAPRVGRGSDWSHYSSVTSHSFSLLSNQVQQHNSDALPWRARVSRIPIGTFWAMLSAGLFLDGENRSDWGFVCSGRCECVLLKASLVKRWVFLLDTSVTQRRPELWPWPARGSLLWPKGVRDYIKVLLFVYKNVLFFFYRDVAAKLMLLLAMLIKWLA